jgi:hypothetical protein
MHEKWGVFIAYTKEGRRQIYTEKKKRVSRWGRFWGTQERGRGVVEKKGQKRKKKGRREKKGGRGFTVERKKKKRKGEGERGRAE